MSAATIVFLALLAVEIPVLVLSLRRSPQTGTRWREVLFAVPILAAFAFRALNAFSTHQVLDWDETYYLSQAVTGAAGRGLYPYIYGFGPMPIMGGTGYAAYSYALAVLIGGASIFSLRTVSLIMAAAGLAGLWTLSRAWYGSGAAWATAAFAATSQIFALSNTARMDSWVFAYVAWALVLVASAWKTPSSWRRHFLAGLVFGLGVEVHIDVLVTAAACGLCYAWWYIRDAASSRRLWMAAHRAVAYAVGLALALALYFAVNVLPDTASYYTMTVRIRVDATTMYSRGTSSLVSSFLSPSIVLEKEAKRYGQLLTLMHPIEIGVILLGIGCLAIRRTTVDRRLLIVVPGVLACAALLLNNASPLYFIHVVPVLLILAGPLFTHGARRSGAVTVSEIRPKALACCAIVICALCASSAARVLRAKEARARMAVAPPPQLGELRARLPVNCKLVADGTLYVPYMADYPLFISFRESEVRVAMLSYYLHDEIDLWRRKDPDAVFSEAPLRPALAEYLAHSRLSRVTPSLWMDLRGCKSEP